VSPASPSNAWTSANPLLIAAAPWLHSQIAAGEDVSGWCLTSSVPLDIGIRNARGVAALANGDFGKGIWSQLPSNCTSSFTLTYMRCAEYGVVGLTECLLEMTKLSTECVQGVWKQVKKCSWWSWLFCVLYAIVATFVCTLFATVAITFCVIVITIELVVCFLWTLVSIVFCLSKANGGTAFLLTDGSVMMQEFKSFFGATWGTTRWWKLSPDQSGSYAAGTWSRLADSSVARTYYASAVLADGRIVVCGGEYSDASGTIKQDDNNTCEIYNPVTNQWSAFMGPTDGGMPPAVWSEIGDAPSILLPDGTFLIGSITDAGLAKLDPSTLTWTSLAPGRSVPSNDEDSWVLMPDNTFAGPSCQAPPSTWVYDIVADSWSRGVPLQQSVVDAAQEIGPGLLRYDGTAFFLGSNEHTAIYSASANPSWSNGPDLPPEGSQALGIADGPAALLPNGNILFGAAPTNASGDFLSPCYYFEFDGVTFNRTNDPPNNDCPSYSTRLLLLPTGDVLFCREGDSSFYAYNSAAAVPQDSFRPIIQTYPSSLVPGSVVVIGGLQFNGLSQAVAYGDDCQTATNYPLVKIVNNQTGHVRYCRTFNHSTVDKNGNVAVSMGVATGSAVITTNVAVPDEIELGDSALFVVANGIASAPVDVSVSQEIF
jgi:Kelch motif